MGYRPTFLNTRPAAEAWKVVRETFIASNYLINRTALGLGVSRSSLMKWMKKNKDYREKMKDLVKKEMEI